MCTTSTTPFEAGRAQVAAELRALADAVDATQLEDVLYRRGPYGRLRTYALRAFVLREGFNPGPGRVCGGQWFYIGDALQAEVEVAANGSVFVTVGKGASNLLGTGATILEALQQIAANGTKRAKNTAAFRLAEEVQQLLGEHRGPTP